jgi:hypothetical protein
LIQHPYRYVGSRVGIHLGDSALVKGALDEEFRELNVSVHSMLC